MAIEKTVVVDRIEVLENGSVQVRERISVFEDGVRISGTHRRHVVSPGDDFSNEEARVQAICAVAHTPEVIATYKAAMAAQGV